MAVTKIASGVGFRNLRIFPLAATGLINATSTTFTEGTLASGVKTLEINDPEPRLITHVGDDAPFALDVLPPLESITGALTMAKQNDTLDAILTPLKSFAVGTANLFPVGTNQRGFEVPVGAMAYRQSEDTDPTSSTFGQRVWQFKIMPYVTFIPLEPGNNDNPEERRYTVRPGFSTKHIWGTAFAVATEGCLRAQIIRGISQYKPKLVAAVGDNSASEFTFPTDAQAVSTSSISVWLDGVPRTTNITKAVDKITFTTSVPGVGVNITVFYETA